MKNSDLNTSFTSLTVETVLSPRPSAGHWLFCWICLLQEFAGEDNSDLFLEERETTIRQAQEEKRRVQMSVPGILGPHEIPEEMQD